MIARLAIACVLACGDNTVAPPDAFEYDACCALGVDGAPACIAAKIAPGTCAVFVCATFRDEACRPRPTRCELRHTSGLAICDVTR